MLHVQCRNCEVDSQMFPQTSGTPLWTMMFLCLSHGFVDRKFRSKNRYYCCKRDVPEPKRDDFTLLPSPSSRYQHHESTHGIRGNGFRLLRRNAL